MPNKSRYVFAVLVAALLLVPVMAQEETVYKEVQFPPGHVLYPVKIFFEDLRERLTFDKVGLILVKQDHLANRIAELESEAVFNGNRNTPMLLQRIEIKRLEIDEVLERLKPECLDSEIGEFYRCDFVDEDSAEAKFYWAVKSQNERVLTDLLEKPGMPEAARKGLLNAINRSTLRWEFANGNLVQGTYKISSSVLAVLPFRSAMVYDSFDEAWYSVVVADGAILISDQMIPSPEYYLYPSEKQMTELKSIIEKVNRRGLTPSDKIGLVVMWYNLDKREPEKEMR